MNRRPPWWPENEPFPPPQFRRMRGRFVGRFLAFFGLFIFLSVSASLLLFWFIVSGFGLLPNGVHPAFPFPFPFAFGCFLLMLVLVSLGIASRGLGRLTAPLDQMIDAAGRVAEGDYSTRVSERGPREVRTLARAFNSMSER